jgi:hypothetical protein
MEQIETYLEKNKTVKLMLLDINNIYQKTGAIEQIKLDVGVSLEFVYSNYFEILKICSF